MCVCVRFVSFLFGEAAAVATVAVKLDENNDDDGDGDDDDDLCISPRSLSVHELGVQGWVSALDSEDPACVETCRACVLHRARMYIQYRGGSRSQGSGEDLRGPMGGSCSLHWRDPCLVWSPLIRRFLLAFLSLVRQRVGGRRV
ncbi:hypothetical protein F5Y07DRAFT_227355 [Xylaria sp. FL0933]|nr:hypothetical protein F5Y07DRAFT_227355 [Xylaria sp. FL0933]